MVPSKVVQWSARRDPAPGGRVPRHRSRVWYASLVVAALAIAVLPAASSTPVHTAPGALCGGPNGCTVATVAPNVAAPLHGVVTNCASASSCDFQFNTTQGHGWANASPPAMTLRLPGEASTSTGLSYATYTARLTGTYTYWTVGNFVGTDANTGKVVYGITNTNFTITCHGHSGRGGGCTYTYTTDNGSIVVDFTNADQTTTAVACAPSTIGSGNSTVCTAWVNDTVNSTLHPTGNVSFYGSYGGVAGFSNGGSCVLIAGACSVSYTAPDEQLGTMPVTATFAGTPSFYTSAGRTSIYVSAGGGGGGNYFAVYFSESGLPNGSAWSVTLGGLTLVSTNVSDLFEVQNGTYPFTISPVAGFTLSPKSGNISVNGSDIGVFVTFAPVSYPVTFYESGLPAGKAWSVSFDGNTSVSTASSIRFNATNGTHTLLVTGPAGFRVSGVPAAGTVDVAGASAARSFLFQRGATFAIAFAEKGLPKNATWCVLFVSVVCTPAPALRFANLTPGTYNYSIVPMVGQVITAKLGSAVLPLTGNLTVGTHGLRVALHYTYPFEVLITESGLPTGTNWSVTIHGVRLYTNNTTIVFMEGNGTYGYKIWPVVGFRWSKTPSYIHILGGPALAQVTFRP